MVRKRQGKLDWHDLVDVLEVQIMEFVLTSAGRAEPLMVFEQGIRMARALLQLIWLRGRKGWRNRLDSEDVRRWSQKYR